MHQTESSFLSEFISIQFGAKKVFVLNSCGCWSNWWNIFCVHCCASCKITATSDKNCGNESKIRLTCKIRRCMPIFLSPEFLTKKHAKMGTFLNIFFSLFGPKSSHNWWTQERNHSHPILHINEVTPKAQSELENFPTLCKLTMEGTSWGWLTICGGRYLTDFCFRLLRCVPSGTEYVGAEWE
jgi:hypothetical protein